MNFQMLNLISQCGKEYGREQMHASGLNDTECKVASFVHFHRDCSQNDVVKAFRMDKSTVCKALKSMEERQLITRTKSEWDGRKDLLRTTPEGERRIVELLNLYNKWLNSILPCLSEKEQQQFENYCQRLLHAAEDLLAEKKRTEK